MSYLVAGQHPVATLEDAKAKAEEIFAESGAVVSIEEKPGVYVDGPVKIGDVFYRSWGYDQTQVNWAVVVGLTPSGKSVRLQEIGGVTVEDSGTSYTRVMPDPDRKSLNHAEKPMTKRIQWTTWRDQSEPYLAENSYSSWSAWDGKSKYATGNGFGH